VSLDSRFNIKDRFNYLFGSTKGLILVAVALTAIVTATWGMLSGPLAEMGVSDVVVRLLRMDIQPAEREGRIIILYHSISMAIIAIETYMITGLLKMNPFFKKAIDAMITAGYLVTMVFGLGFAYFGQNWTFHGLFIFGNSLIFFAGILLVIALWPWKKEYYVTDKEYAHTKSGFDLERFAFFATAVTTVISALFGAIPGSYFGNGFEAFLAENILRYPDKTTMQYSVIGHLHIMLALIAIMLTLIIGRWLNFRGFLHKVAMPLMILGTIVLSVGVWGVVTPLEPIAHMIIYVGATEDAAGLTLTSAEASRQLTIARKEQIDLEMEVTRRQRIPLDVLDTINETAFSNVVGMLKAHEGKMLTAAAIGDMLGELREIGARVKDAAK
jgi:hypothetical protein